MMSEVGSLKSGSVYDLRTNVGEEVESHVGQVIEPGDVNYRVCIVCG